MPPLVERLSARFDAALNPLMVKEAHQSFRNRALLIASLVALGVPLLVFMGTIASSSILEEFPDGIGERAGDGFFRTLAGCAMLVTWAAVPAGAAAQFQAEIRSRTIDLTLLTSLTPWQLASGRFQAAGLQVVLLFAFLTPFAVASIALGGVGADRVLLQLLLIFAIALLQCSAALLTVTAITLAPRLLALFVLMLGGEMFFALSFGVAIAANVFSSLPVWWLLAIVGEAGLGTLFFLRLAADMLAPPGMRSYLRSKLMMVVLLALFFAIPILAWQLGTPADADEPILFVSAFWLCSFGLLWCGAERRPGSAGKLGYLFEDGVEPTAVYVCTLLALIAIVAHLAKLESWIVLAFLVYFVALVGFAALLQARWLSRNPEGFFAGLLIVAVVDLIATFMVYAQGGWNVGNAPPIATALLPVVWLERESRGTQLPMLLPFAFGVAALLWARALRRKHG